MQQSFETFLAQEEKAWPKNLRKLHSDCLQMLWLNFEKQNL